MLHRRVIGACLAVAAALCGPVHAIDLAGVGGFSYRVPVVSLQDARFKSTLKQKHDFSCGSAAVASLLTFHYGIPITEEIAFEQMFIHGDQQKIRREGFSLLDMKRFLAARGFEADGFEVGLDKLEEAGIPAIALITDNGYHHFVVVKGLRAGRVLVGDPSRGTRTMPRRAFESLWTNGVLFVIHNRTNEATFNKTADWRLAPLAPIATGLGHDGLAGATMMRHGPGEF
jgi:predicted double-glycine peptidase